MHRISKLTALATRVGNAFGHAGGTVSVKVVDERLARHPATVGHLPVSAASSTIEPPRMAAVAGNTPTTAAKRPRRLAMHIISVLSIPGMEESEKEWMSGADVEGAVLDR